MPLYETLPVRMINFGFFSTIELIPVSFTNSNKDAEEY